MELTVCHISFSSFPGQGSLAIYEFAHQLALVDNDVIVVATSKKNEPSYERKNDNLAVYKTHTKKIKKASLYPLIFTIKAILLLSKITNLYEVDIVHIHNFPGACMIPLFLRRKAKKWIYFTTSGPIKKGIYSYLGFKEQIFESFFFDHIILRDESHVKQFNYRNKEDISIVPIGANFDMFKSGKNEKLRQKMDMSQDSIVFVYTGSVHPARNVKNLIYAFQKINKIYKNTKLLIVGDGDDLVNLKNLAESLNMENDVIFTGYVDYESMPAYLNAADIAISYVPITPQYDLQPPLKTVEYLASGLPTIATDTLGNRGFIKDGYNGLLVDDDIVSLADAMTKLIENEELREKFKKNSRNSVFEYDWKNIVENKLIPVYEKVLE